ncbi:MULTISPECIES: hypothetical protein [Halomarina]|uniref:Uncharacterized protein n=2 Tax=Halomarina TaxID=871740 RepID=A0A6B0GLS1_9EURY|nr:MULTISPECIES: hypothetical protein [Halomarina]MWG33723.1 hypothetical protein [Halomarina oriensis]
MSSQFLPRIHRPQSASKGFQLTVIGGVLHALLAVGVRIVAGAPTALWDPYMLWALLGGFVVGACFTGLYVRAGLLLPGVVTLSLLAIGGVLTSNAYASLNGASPSFAWTPMTVYVTFWPFILAVALLVGGGEWLGRRLLHRAV